MTIVRSNPDPLPNKVKETIRAIEEQRQSCLFLLLSDEAINRSLVNLIDKRCRETIAEVPKIDILIQSGGGDIDATYQLVNLFRDYKARVNVLIPGYAKSAATFFCLGAQEILMGRSAELGPLDAQIPDPREPGQFISALDEFKALEFLREYALETLDLTIRMILRRSHLRVDAAISEAVKLVSVIMTPLYQQVDPINFGESKRILEIGEEYGRRVMSRYPQPSEHSGSEEDRINGILNKLIWGYPSHGFVIDYKEGQQLGLNVKLMDPHLENLCQLVVDSVEECIGFMPQQAGNSEKPGTTSRRRKRGRT